MAFKMRSPFPLMRKKKNKTGTLVTKKRIVSDASKNVQADVEKKLTAKGKAQGKKSLDKFSKAQSKSPKISDSQAKANIHKRKMRKDPYYASELRAKKIKEQLKSLDKNSKEYKKTMDYVNRMGIRL